MLKKLITFQKLLINSMPPININSKNTSEKMRYGLGAFAMFLMNMLIFTGNTSSSNDVTPILFPVISIWMINRMLYSDQRLFETVPVSRKYTVLNVFLLSIILIFILYIAVSIVGSAFVGILFGFLYLVYPQGFSQSPPEPAVHQIINTTKGNMLMLYILVIVIFAGVAITFIKNKKLRLTSFAGFAIIGYGLLFFLKLTMPISPITGKVEFLESFSIMPHAGTILLFVAIATIIISITSVLIGYKLYVGKSNSSKCY
ncbi:hypothetical protein [Clostridium estertheticum]|uniref:ABC-2 transporter permease n=1 Tax=Clostridium estertheticum subsp. estertheticum TaxID=1552 RepID=A0A1J0GKG9_9CLOT|nr:hypothetical protein [Clostridium estertheticum]APC41440.1 hypothetical protein A7L45_15830 [Clostridium estertheticum subsp. estertheticum]MBZ9616658.1 hypothetical protein [Clostridium estertheticum subsp. laramiense]WAG72377.1 hypothetical protein LL032_14540 [Clostridium estertheticum]